MIDRLLDKTFCLHASTLFSVSRLFIRKQTFFISPPSLACLNLPRIPHESVYILYLKGVAPMPHPGITCSYTGPGGSLRSRGLEVVGTRKNVSPSRAPVLSFARYFQAPATQASPGAVCRKSR